MNFSNITACGKEMRGNELKNKELHKNKCRKNGIVENTAVLICTKKIEKY